MTLYQPGHFTIADPVLGSAAAFELIAQNPFATLVTASASEPLITHCPITALRDGGGATVLEGHVARANPNWHAWRDGANRALAIFHGPHAYVSPTLYTEAQSVPTWNYVVVHVCGGVTLIEQEEDKRALLGRLIAHLEPAYAERWAALAEDYRRRMLGAIVGFRIGIERIDAKFKLGQNRTQADRDKVRAAFAAGNADERGLADWIDRLSRGG